MVYEASSGNPIKVTFGPATKLSFREMVAEAHEAGKAAGEAALPTPMDVTDGETVWHVSEGPCGFAWIWFPGNIPFGRWAKKAGIASKSYPTGLSIWVSQFGQSMARKEAYAHAFAKVLRDNGVDPVYAQSRMD